MKHDWENITGSRGLEDMFNHGRRKCQNCGVEQTKESEQSWMRVTGYCWYPLVGRCPGKPKRGKKKGQA